MTTEANANAQQMSKGAVNPLNSKTIVFNVVVWVFGTVLARVWPSMGDWIRNNPIDAMSLFTTITAAVNVSLRWVTNRVISTNAPVRLSPKKPN